MPSTQNVIQNLVGLSPSEITPSKTGEETGYGSGLPEASVPAEKSAPPSLELTAPGPEPAVPPIHLQAAARIFAVGALRAAQAGGWRSSQSSREEDRFSEEGNSHSEKEEDAPL